MAEPTLLAGQYSIGPPGGPALVYGRGTTAQVSSTETDTGTVTVQDQAIVGQDGQLFGVDTLPGMIITQTGQCNTQPGLGASAMDAYSALAAQWNEDDVRLSNGAVQVLRAFYPGSLVVRRCYGRGRKIMPTMGMVFNGLVPFTAQFQAADNVWYSDTQSAIEMTTIPAVYGGILMPATPPWNLVIPGGQRQNVVQNSGARATWPVITFTGPVAQPSLAFVGVPVSIGYNGTLAQGSTLVIDTRPWARTALLNGASVAGQLTGVPMISMRLQPGSTQVAFTGTDLTGLATCTIAWRNASLAIGGSS